MKNGVVLFGVLFGFALSRAGATEFAAINGMFLLTDLHLAGVMAMAIAMAALGFAWLRRHHRVRANRDALALTPKPMQRGVIVGGLLFGSGWAISGSCPGTALAQVGQGMLSAGVIVAGILAGVILSTLVPAARTQKTEAQPQRVGDPMRARTI